MNSQEISGQWLGFLQLSGPQPSSVPNVSKAANVFAITINSQNQKSTRISVTTTVVDNSILDLAATIDLKTIKNALAYEEMQK